MRPTPPEPPTADLSGTTVGRFVIGPLLGKGGMGEVYRAEDTGLRRAVALKRIAPTIRADPHARRRLWKEAESTSQLNDSHIAAVYDVVEDNEELFLVMEYVEGQTLRRRLTQPVTVPEFLEIAVQCATALVAAHKRGILHQDIKPENIMLTPAGQVKVLDFGLARSLPRASGVTTRDSLASAEFTGTLPYMAPEVLQERESDTRTDIFSLGVVLYEALAGRNPFRGEGFLATCERILHEEPVPLRQLNPQVPPELERIVAKMLAKDPARRYSSAADLAVDLDALRRTRGEAGGQPAPPRRTPKLNARSGSAIIAAVTAVAIIAAFAYRYFHRPVLAEHATIIAADFENKTGDKLFDQTVSEAMRQAMQQSRYVHLVPRAQVLDAAQRMGRNDVMRVDAALAREICQRENYRAVLIGEVASSGSGYAITAQIVDPAEGAPVLTETASLSSPTQLYPAVDGLAKGLRQHLGESLTQVSKSSTPLARVTTPSLEALQRYSRALDSYAVGDLEAFFPLGKSAIELDPDFAMAHLYLALGYSQLGNEKEALAQVALARKGVDRVTERERYLILATDYESQRLYEKAVENYRLITELYPDDLEAYQGLASASDDAGRPEDAISSEKQALRLNPNSARDHVGLIRYLNRLNRFQEALAAYESANSRKVRSPELHWGAGLAYLGQGDAASARREFQLLRQEGGPYAESLAALCMARVLMYEGRLREAADALRAGLVLDEKLHSETWIPVRRYLLADVERTRGRLIEFRAEAQRLANAARASADPWELRRAAMLELEFGDLRTAQTLLTRLSNLRDKQGAFAQACYENLKGALELTEGKIGAAVESQRRASAFFPLFAPYASLGEAYAAEHDWTDAADAYRRYLERKGDVFTDDSPSDWVLAHLYLARAFARAGDTQNALSSYDEFLRLWAGADPDLPSLRQARAERERLSMAYDSSSSRAKGSHKAP